MAGSEENAARRRSLVLRLIYAVCLTGAAYNHWWAIYHHGLFWNYGGFPKASTAFWTVLAFLDPAAVTLLIARPNIGVAATVAIIVSDVSTTYGYRRDIFRRCFKLSWTRRK